MFFGDIDVQTSMLCVKLRNRKLFFIAFGNGEKFIIIARFSMWVWSRDFSTTKSKRALALAIYSIHFTFLHTLCKRSTL